MSPNFLRASICLAVMGVMTSSDVSELFLRAELGYLVGCGTAALMMAVFLVVKLKRAGPGSLELLVEAIEHEPLEI